MIKSIQSAPQKFVRAWDSNSRSLLKAISWRITGSIDTFVVSFIITGQFTLAGGIALTEIATKILLYWLHERLWNKINFGRHTL
jgi:uncharacterized membrane protein